MNGTNLQDTQRAHHFVRARVLAFISVFYVEHRYPTHRTDLLSVELLIARSAQQLRQQRCGSMLHFAPPPGFFEYTLPCCIHDMSGILLCAGVQRWRQPLDRQYVEYQELDGKDQGHEWGRRRQVPADQRGFRQRLDCRRSDLCRYIVWLRCVPTV